MASAVQGKRTWGWYFFDWASQPYHTLLVTFVFGPFFASIAAEHFMQTGMGREAAAAQAQSMWSRCLATTGLIIAFTAPIMGSIADTTGRRLPWIVSFSAMYVLGAAGIWWTNPDGSNLVWALCIFGFGFIGAEYALIFVNAQLPSLGKGNDLGDISGSGYAFGYVGGLISLAIMLTLFIDHPDGHTYLGLQPALGLNAGLHEGTRFAGPFAAIWFAVFMVPYFLWMSDVDTTSKGSGIGDALRHLGNSIMNLRNRTSLSAYLGSSMFYRDALNGLYAFGGLYATLVLEWSLFALGVFGIAGAMSAAVFAWGGGLFDRRFGPKPVITCAVWGLMAVCFIVVGMDRTQLYGIPIADDSNLPDVMFFCCGILIGGFGGTLQSASRTLMARHANPASATESFGLYGLSGRATAFVAPALVGLFTELSGSARIGISPIMALFLVGVILLHWVNANGDSETWAKSGN
ncbi:MAG: MFS transporter [Roseovarius sp.]|nr:MFS transporter [Roseovarius sp.]